VFAEKGARLHVAPVDDTGQVRLDEYEKLLGPKTRLVAIAQVSNALGTVTPVSAMVEAAHRHGARVLVDGAQAVSHMRVDVQALNCDFYVFSGHKVFAPTGIGVVYGKSEVLDNTPPWQGGGNMIQDVTFEKTLYQPPPQRFEAGTGSIADAVGLGAAIDYVERVGMENITRHEHMACWFTPPKNYCNAFPDLRIIGTAREKAGVHLVRHGGLSYGGDRRLSQPQWDRGSLVATIAHSRSCAALGSESTAARLACALQHLRRHSMRWFALYGI
jgi:cysteine desulfurase/selenocysteine lyase